ncbi:MULTISPECIES: FUSC family protein [Caproicibacterium]|uniref:Aromatic acid exporter family protein n=1 Tax=Caproicibacterium argilliputei TaxID=3030016 RepID=A0AA97D7G6_9FIRM|nr:aromatic acid exporter family protein [Caproicibacterium argilliputei]WOC31955.1 aromatic acid exporter family protein [Caproicibacterium argilliputei]
MIREAAHRLRQHTHLGLRIIKTGIAVTLCMALCDLLQLQQPFVAVVTAIISMGRSIDSTVRTGKDHFLAAIVGAVCGALLYHVSPHNAGLCGIGVILVIFLCQVLRLYRGTLMASFMFAMVMLHPDTAGTIQTVAWCLLAALLGIVVALAVNLLILPPNYAQNILQRDNLIHAMLTHAAEICEERLSAPDLDAVRVQIQQLQHDIRLYTSEWKLFRNRDDAVAAIAHRLVTYQEILNDLWAIDRLQKKLDSETAAVFAYHINRANLLLRELQPQLVPSAAPTKETQPPEKDGSDRQ